MTYLKKENIAYTIALCDPTGNPVSYFAGAGQAWTTNPDKAALTDETEANRLCAALKKADLDATPTDDWDAFYSYHVTRITEEP